MKLAIAILIAAAIFSTLMILAICRAAGQTTEGKKEKP